MKKQVLVIHGGDTFDTYEEYISFLKDYEIELSDLKGNGWKNSLQEKLGEDYEVFKPQMPDRDNAKYMEWKIWFEKILNLLNNEIILVGHSLGGIFLAKYLSENKLSKKILATFLVAAPFDDKDSEYTLPEFTLSEDLSLFEKQSDKIIIYHSKDDPVVPFVDLNKYSKKLKSARIVIFEDKGHFGQLEFPEIVSDILRLN
jgi:uncharacterized protein